MMMIFYCIFSGYIQKQRGHLICVLGQSFYCYLILSWDQEQTQHRFYAASLFFPPLEHLLVNSNLNHVQAFVFLSA